MTSTLRGGLAAVALCALLSACGGGGGGGSPAPATLPATVAITGAARADTGAQQHFATDVVNTGGLAFQWDFGDGATGSGASANHAYAAPGSYQVTLVVTAGGADSRTATSSVQVAAFSNVAGLSCTRPDAAGWCWQHAIVTGRTINDVFFVDATHAWAVGDASTILKSTDGGGTWAPVALDASMPSMSLTSVRFRDAQHGMALGNGAWALQTSDGGATWTLNTLGGLVHFTSNPITFADYGPARIVITSPFPGGSIASVDDGVTWLAVGGTWGDPGGNGGLPVFTTAADCWNVQYDAVRRMAGCGATGAVSLAVAQPGAPYDTILAGAFASSNDGLLVGYDYASGAFGLSTMTAWSTGDAGATWTQFTPTGLLSTADYSGMQLQMVDASNGLLFTPGKLWAYWTQDGGHAWTAVASSTRVTTPYTGYTATGWISGSTMWQSSTNHVSISTDRGLTWHDATLAAEDIPTSHSGVAAAAVTHLTDVNNYVVMMHQRFYATHDGGATFTRILGPDSRDAGSTSSAPWFSDTLHGKVLLSQGTLLSTVDGGHSWAESHLPNGADSYAALAFTSSTQGWMVLHGALMRSTDGGANWSTASTSAMTGLSGMSWGDATHAWAWSDDTLFATADGGATWSAVPLPGATALISAALTGPLTGAVAAANGGMLSTQDGGATWQAATSPAGYCPLVHTTGHELWCLATTGSRSLDDGRTWQSADPSGSGDRTVGIAFADARHGWAVTLAGSVLYTGDGGATWSAQPVGDGLSFTSVVAVDATTAWIVTRDGQVLATATGGW